jgi:hypothetical protein
MCNQLSFAQLRGVDLLGDKKKIEIQFRYAQDYILLDIMLNETLPLSFIMDTGAEHTILFQKFYGDLMGLNYTQEISILGTDMSSTILAYITRGVGIRLKDNIQVKRDIVVLSEDFMQLNELTGTRIHGILGGSFFQGLIVEINYKKKKIVLHHPNHYKEKYHKKFTTMDIDVNQNKPYLKADLELFSGAAAEINLLFDTGAGLTFLLHTNTSDKLKLPEHVIKGNLGQGLGGMIEGYTGLIKSLTIDKYRFSNLITSFQNNDTLIYKDVINERNGLLGNIIISRFHVIIDYNKQKLHLKPIGNYNEKIDYDKSGLLVFAYGRDLNKYYVKEVIPGSPAELAGLKEGDLILKVGFWPSSFLSLQRIVNKLSGKAGKKIKMKILRNGEKISKEFTLRDMYIVPKRGN